MIPRFLRAAVWLGIGTIIVCGCAQTASVRGLDVLQEIRSFNQPLIEHSPSQASTKFRKMQKDLVAFNRGVNHVFYRYVQSVGLPERWMGPHSGGVTLHGDCHVENIGAYRTANGKVVVDLIDFDDSFRGPALLDVYRAASSLYLAVKTDPMREKLVKIFVKSYAQTMKKIAAGEISTGMVMDESSPYGLVQDLVHDAAGATRQGFFKDFVRCRAEGGKMVFAYSPEYEKISTQTAQALLQSYLARKDRPPADSRFYEMQDAVVEHGSGVGSAGVFKVRIIVRGPSDDPSDDVVLEFKQELVPAGEIFSVARYSDQGRRVLEGDRIMETLTPGHIGTARLGDMDFFVSELSACYQELEWNKVLGTKKMKESAEVLGILLAKGHARSTADTGAVAGEISALLADKENRFFDDVFAFCAGYNDFLQKGYEQFSHELTFSPLLFIFWPRWA